MQVVMLRLLIVLGFGLWFAPQALAAEQRCNELGANCVCSEPLNTATLVGPYSVYFNPGDSTTKECTADVFGDPSFKGYAIRYQDTGLTMSNDPTALSRLPNRTSALQYFIRGREGYTGPFEVGHNQVFAPSRSYLDPLLPGTFTFGGRTEYVSKKRVVARVYMYHSEAFTFTNGFDSATQCTNGKHIIADTVDTTHAFEPTGTISAYDYGWDIPSYCANAGLPANCGPFRRDGIGGTNLVADCCNTGPSLGDHGPAQSSEYKGKWWMFEWAITNRLGPGYRLQVWGRNVTDNGPERVIIDTDGSSGNGPTAVWTPSPTLTPGEINPVGRFLTWFSSSKYRAGTCPGWAGQSHFMMAQSDTDANLRIGPAYEVEGGSGQPPDTTPPAAPSGLRVF